MRTERFFLSSQNVKENGLQQYQHVAYLAVNQFNQSRACVKYSH